MGCGMAPVKIFSSHHNGLSVEVFLLYYRGFSAALHSRGHRMQSRWVQFVLSSVCELVRPCTYISLPVFVKRSRKGQNKAGQTWCIVSICLLSDKFLSDNHQGETQAVLFDTNHMTDHRPKNEAGVIAALDSLSISSLYNMLANSIC